MSDCSKDRRCKPGFPKRQAAVSFYISVYRATLEITALVKVTVDCPSSVKSFGLKNRLCVGNSN